MILEACVDNIHDALKAEQKGAHQIELCARLDLDGLTPSEELIQACKYRLSIPIHVMIRPRGGNFIYSPQEIKKMIQQIQRVKKLQVDGVVLGVLNAKKEINFEQLSELIDEASPLTITFHKAIDLCPNLIAEFQKLDAFQKIDQVLTSGGHPTAVEGIENLKKMVEIAQNCQVKVAGKVTQENLTFLNKATGATLFHGKKIVS